MSVVKLELQPRTPIWTGGVEGQTDRVHATGIIGSLRWWYEAIVRGLGGWACDPSEDSCIYEAGKEICMACQVFGTTGWRRRFRLEVEAADYIHNLAWQEKVVLKLQPPGRSCGWFPGPGYVEPLRVILTGDAPVLDELLAVFRFLEAWGNIGAKPQCGYGCFKIGAITRDGNQVAASPFEFRPRGTKALAGLPDLRTFIFFKLRFTPTNSRWWADVPGIGEHCSQHEPWPVVERLARRGMVPVTRALKNTLRFRRNTRIRSKVSLSWAYRVDNAWEIRGWGSIPEDHIGQSAREEIIRSLQPVLESPAEWFKALNVHEDLPAEVTLEPTPAPWNPHTADQVAAFLSRMTLATSPW